MFNERRRKLMNQSYKRGKKERTGERYGISGEFFVGRRYGCQPV
jgi:hypothetical protein